LQYLNKDNEIKEIGNEGEKWVYKIEKRRLYQLGRRDLSEKVEWVSKTQGDGLGYDILSFDNMNGSNIYIEVKTTNGEINTPFFITVNEMEFAEQNEHNYKLYKVFKYSNEEERKLFIMAVNDFKKCYCKPIRFIIKPDVKA
jgi:hypothetical protein